MGLLDWFYSALSGLRDEGLADVNVPGRTVKILWVEFRSRAIEGSAKVGWVVDLARRYYVIPILDSLLRWVNAIQASLNDWLEGGRRRPLHSTCRLIHNAWLGNATPDESPEASILSYAVVVSAVVLLSLVYQYLTGNVDIGSSKAYSRSSLDFRDIFVAVVLFLGAYVWIKFRKEGLRGVHKRIRVDKRGRPTKVVYDARLTPPKCKCKGEAVPKLELGRFATEQEAHYKFRIAAFYYGRDEGLLDGWYEVPAVPNPLLFRTGREKRAWVIGQAKMVYEDFKEAFSRREGKGDVDFPAERHQPAPVSQVENLGMAMPGDQGLECAPNSFGGMREVRAVSNGHSLGFEEGSAHLSPTTESGMSLNGSGQGNFPGAPTSHASVLNSVERKPPLVVRQAEDSGMANFILGECASQSLGEMHQSPGFQEDSAPPVTQLPPDIHSGMGMNNSNQSFNFPQIVPNQQELIQELDAQIGLCSRKLQERDAQIDLFSRTLQERDAQISELKRQLEEAQTRISDLGYQQACEQIVNEIPTEMMQSMP